MIKFYDMIPHSEFEKRANKKLGIALIILVGLLLIYIALL